MIGQPAETAAGVVTGDVVGSPWGSFGSHTVVAGLANGRERRRRRILIARSSRDATNEL